MALDDFLETFTMQVYTEADDGFGGVNQVPADGEIFRGKAVLKTSTEAQIAQQQGYRAMYDLVHTGIALHREDRVKHMKSGTVYRITSDSRDMETPEASALRFAQVTCEVVSV